MAIVVLVVLSTVQTSNLKLFIKADITLKKYILGQRE